jgi:hypothetical protein
LHLGRRAAVSVAVRGPGAYPGSLPIPHVSPAKLLYLGVEPRGLEPLPSAVQRRHDALLALSGVYKTAANSCSSMLTHISAFQEIYSGCCTVTATQRARITQSCVSTLISSKLRNRIADSGCSAPLASATRGVSCKLKGTERSEDQAHGRSSWELPGSERQPVTPVPILGCES